MSTAKPLITIYMPVYNAQAHLREAIDSILRQTYAEFEFIIIDDGSTDGSAQIIDDYALRDKRIIAIHQTNQGVVKTANKAIDLALGEYIARADADDISFDNKLEDLLSCALKNKNAVVVCGNIEVIDLNGEFLYRDLVLPYSDDLKRAFFLRNPIPNGATLISREALIAVGGFDDVFAEDCHLWTKLIDKGDFLATGTAVYRWRMNPTGLTLTNARLSEQKEKEYVNIIWDKGYPAFVSRREILGRSRSYLENYTKYGRDYKKSFMTDLSRVAVHLLKRGAYKQGLLQLLIIASTGRSGLKIVLRRLHLVSQGHVQKLRRRAPFGENET